MNRWSLNKSEHVWRDWYIIEGFDGCNILFFGPLLRKQVILLESCTILIQLLPQMLTSANYDYSYLLQPKLY